MAVDSNGLRSQDVQDTWTPKTASATFTRPADVTAYASGDLMANSTTAGSVTPLSFTPVRASGRGVQINRARVSKTGTGVSGAVLRVHLYEASPTVANGDNGAFSTSQAATYLGYFDVTAMTAFTDGAAGLGSLGTGAQASTTATTIYALLEARGAYTPASGEVFTVTLEFMQT